MIAALLLAATAAASGAERFAEAFPGATTVGAPGDAARLVAASGFAAPGLGRTAETAARAFLARHGEAFGVVAGQELRLQGAPAPGRPGAVRFERWLHGRLVFDGDVTVGVDATRAVVLVNASDVPPRVAGRPRLSRAAAVKAARAGLQVSPSAAAARATRGWKASGATVRPAWRVDLVASAPPGDWRTYVDAETGAVLQRVDRRRTALRPVSAAGDAPSPR